MGQKRAASPRGRCRAQLVHGSNRAWKCKDEEMRRLLSHLIILPEELIRLIWLPLMFMIKLTIILSLIYTIFKSQSRWTPPFYLTPTVSSSTSRVLSFRMTTTSRSATWTPTHLATPSGSRMTTAPLTSRRKWPTQVLVASFFTTWTSWRHGPLTGNAWGYRFFSLSSQASRSLRSPKSILSWCCASETIALPSFWSTTLLFVTWPGICHLLNDVYVFTVNLILKDHSYYIYLLLH